MSDENCPTCHKPKNFADDLVQTLETKGAIDKIATSINSRLSSGAVPDLTQTIRDALSNFNPNVRVVHHGIEDLKSCTTCAPIYEKDVQMRIAADRLSRLEQKKVAQVARH